MKSYRFMSFIASVLVILVYLAFTVIASFRYPMPYSPLTNWLSDLGNVKLNPHGAVTYNIGVISSGILLLLFFLGLSRWKIENNRIQIIMVYLTQACGMIGSICMVLSAVFPMNLLEIHKFWSTSLYIMLSTSFAFLAAALRYHKQVPRWLLILGLATAVIVIVTSFIPDIYVLEWITVSMFLSYVCLVGIQTKRVKINMV
jgi:hypothetical membrane protein